MPVFVCLKLRAMPYHFDQISLPNNMIYGGCMFLFWGWRMGQLEPEGWRQSCRCYTPMWPNPKNTMDGKTWLSFPGWQHLASVVRRCCWKNEVQSASPHGSAGGGGGRHLEAWTCFLLEFDHVVFFPLWELQFVSSTVIYCNHEYNGFFWVLYVLLTYHQGCGSPFQ